MARASLFTRVKQRLTRARALFLGFVPDSFTIYERSSGRCVTCALICRCAREKKTPANGFGFAFFNFRPRPHESWPNSRSRTGWGSFTLKTKKKETEKKRQRWESWGEDQQKSVMLYRGRTSVTTSCHAGRGSGADIRQSFFKKKII